RGKGDILADLRKAVKKADKVYLATDPDREGEAISWHLAQALKLDPDKTYRITFNEITKNAMKDALKHPRTIDIDMVDAQQTRRMLDRMVGYRISPLLWVKIKRGLSAGRVQSVALRMVADREEEIAAFVPEEYWTIDGDFAVEGEKKPLQASFYGKKSRMNIRSQEEADQVLADLKDADCKIASLKSGTRLKKPPLPFTTSTLQQDAVRALNFSTQKTMRLAQQLYEGVDVPGEGTVGLITYLRTDSTRVSAEADAAVKAYIADAYGKEYVTDAQAKEKTGAKIQDAHEAIRPSDVKRTPAMMKDILSRDLLRLYQLIWKRFTASRMAPASYETTSVSIAAGEYIFKVSAARQVFEGFLAVYNDGEEEDKGNKMAGKLTLDSVLKLTGLTPKQHFTQPPAHYTEATLVRALEEKGIGRPSTYAPTITTLLARRYILREQKNLYVTELGEAVNNMMKDAFPIIVDESFTANMESLLDSVGEGNLNWKEVVRNFYPDLDAAVEEAEGKLEKVTIQDEVTDVICDLCGRNMVIKYGPHGKFLACPGFPECKNTKPFLEKAGVSCPKCGQDIVIRRSRKGRRFYGCENPDCDFISWQKPAKEKCPQCGSYMLEKGSRLVCQAENCGFSMNKE
ncbi:MAG: type I DNA topoisomerase, partial [Lachnospiraceae bacterium]|nr:type I DNA topoisomerase [Lachnospiraceae bacterium]